MATTAEVIKALQDADPSGNLEVVIKHEDGWAYSVSDDAEAVSCQDGIIKDEEEEETPNCVALSTV